MSKRYNWRPDLPDHRDHKYKLKVQYDPKTLPTSVDLRKFCSPVFDQGNIGSCTGNSIAGMFEFLELKEIRDKDPLGLSSPELFDPSTYTPASRLFIYYCERCIEGDVNQDGGAEIRDGIKVIVKTGVCKEATWPYVEKQVFTKPTEAAYSEAKNHKVKHYMALENLQDMKHCLAEGYPFVFGMSVYSSFESDEVAANGVVSMPGSDDDCEGGHAIMAVGYDDSTKMILVRNSWGADWGIGGYFYLPYEYISNPDLCDDFWTIRN